jgi:hypothetical protein
MFRCGTCWQSPLRCVVLGVALSSIIQRRRCPRKRHLEPADAHGTKWQWSARLCWCGQSLWQPFVCVVPTPVPYTAPAARLITVTTVTSPTTAPQPWATRFPQPWRRQCLLADLHHPVLAATPSSATRCRSSHPYQRLCGGDVSCCSRSGSPCPLSHAVHSRYAVHRGVGLRHRPPTRCGDDGQSQSRHGSSTLYCAGQCWWRPCDVRWAVGQRRRRG